jgi:threonine aldolase
MEMLQSMFTRATFTDDLYSRDPTTVELESKVASLTGHESAMFVPSGTMGNQLCLRTHLTQPPHSVLCDYRAHIYTNEAGALAMLSQAMTTTVQPKNGKYITLEEVKANIVGEDDHYAPTRLVSLENTIYGVVFPYSEAKRISEYIRSEYKGQIKLHLDGIPHHKDTIDVGARLWNGVVAEGITLKEYCSLFDSVSVCFSKGLSTPVGSVIVGTAPFIKKARHFKKAFGGSVRLPGILSAACLVSLDQIIPKIAQTHVVAKQIAARLEKLGYGFTLPVDTNMVFLDLDVLGVTEKTYQAYCEREGVQVFDYHRIVVHHQTSQEGVEKLITALTRLMDDVKSGKVQQA